MKVSIDEIKIVEGVVAHNEQIEEDSYLEI